MRLSAEDYFKAASEYLAALRKLYENKEYVLTHYVSGLAIECLFFAFKFRSDLNATLDERHDLIELAHNSGFFDLVPEKFKELNAALMLISVRWKNSHRYRSTKALRRYIVDEGLHRRIKGDVVKENSRIIMDAALVLFTHGAKQWLLSNR